MVRILPSHPVGDIYNYTGSGLNPRIGLALIIILIIRVFGVSFGGCVCAYVCVRRSARWQIFPGLSIQRFLGELLPFRYLVTIW